MRQCHALPWLPLTLSSLSLLTALGPRAGGRCDVNVAHAVEAPLTLEGNTFHCSECKAAVSDPSQTADSITVMLLLLLPLLAYDVLQ